MTLRKILLVSSDHRGTGFPFLDHEARRKKKVASSWYLLQGWCRSLRCPLISVYGSGSRLTAKWTNHNQSDSDESLIPPKHGGERKLDISYGIRNRPPGPTRSHPRRWRRQNFRCWVSVTLPLPSLDFTIVLRSRLLAVDGCPNSNSY